MNILRYLGNSRKQRRDIDEPICKFHGFYCRSEFLRILGLANAAQTGIYAIDDLFNIHSLGFRGEALYSIAAIADVILRSKTAKQDSGWEIHMRGGEKLDMRPVSMPTGTEIEVKELFFNTKVGDPDR